MRVCVLCCEGAQENAYDMQPYCFPFAQSVSYAYLSGDGASSAEQLRELAKSTDVFVNFCDGLEGDGFSGVGVVSALEALGVPYTGARLPFYNISKEEMKMKCAAAGVPTPRWVFCFDAEGGVLAAKSAGLSFPMIVKHFNGWGSVMIENASRVSNEEELATQVRRVVHFGNGALIEEFIEGREFTVLVAENPACPACPVVLRPIEVEFRNGATFKTYGVKWETWDADMMWKPSEDKCLNNSLMQMASRAFIACGGSGFGRADFRVDAQGRPYFLEINANCGIFYHPKEFGSADYCIANDPYLNHVSFMELLIHGSIVYQARKKLGEIEPCSLCTCVSKVMEPDLGPSMTEMLS